MAMAGNTGGVVPSRVRRVGGGVKGGGGRRALTFIKPLARRQTWRRRGWEGGAHVTPLGCWTPRTGEWERRDWGIECSASLSSTPDDASDGPLPRSLRSPLPGVRRRVSEFLGITHSSFSKLASFMLLFVCLAFNNAIVDTTKDSLVVTALGGAEQIPFLTVYAILPASVVFVWAYNKLAKRIDHFTLFYVTMAPFLLFFGLFAFVLFPNIDTLHFSAETASRWLAILPSGLGPAVGMIQHWTFTLYYTFAELWGDVIISLLFWSLANEATSVHEAKLIYPILGFGANVAYAIAGLTLRAVNNQGWQWQVQIRFLVGTFLVASFVAACVHSYIRYNIVCFANAVDEELCDAEYLEEEGASSEIPDECKPKPQPKPKPRASKSLLEVLKNPSIGALAAISIAQGVAFSIFQVVWKGQVLRLHPTPAAFNACMGEVQLWSGVITAAFMIGAPYMFRRFGWMVAASVTPLVLATGGTAFFLGSAFLSSHSSALGPVVAIGALIYIFMKAAKFSLFKPAEEMVYIGLDESSKSTGKAAVDVLGAQLGKAGGSMVQQVMLLFCSTLSGAMIPLLGLHSIMIGLWIQGLAKLSKVMGTETAKV